MKRHKIQPQGFTLIEILVVIAIIAVLASISVPIATRVFNSSKKAAATAAMKQTVEAVSAYYRAHGSLDYNNANFNADGYGMSSISNPASGAQAKATEGHDFLIAALTGKNTGSKNRTAYLKLNDAKYPDSEDVQDGVTRDASNVAHGILDPWGNPYFVQADLNYDGEIEVDSSAGTDHGGKTANLAGKHYIMISAGPDGVLGNNDDVKSYQ